MNSTFISTHVNKALMKNATKHLRAFCEVLCVAKSVFFLSVLLSFLQAVVFFCGLLFPPVQLKRGWSPGRRRRRHEEAACNIEERGEEVEKRGRRRGG